MVPRILLVALTATLPAQDAITWEPDLATAQARAAESGKPVLAYFTFET